MHNFKVIPFSNSLDLDFFYKEAAKKGFVNNCTKKMLVNSFDNEKEKQIWILYFKNLPIGSVAAHSFDEVMGQNTYRICARTCILTEHLDGHKYQKNLRTKNVITQHQNPTAQFLIPACLNWTPTDSRVFITSNKNDTGTQKKVHNIFAPLMQKSGQMQKVKEVTYRGCNQTVWEFNREKFYEELSKYPRWF